MLLGSHVSCQGGLFKAVERAKEIDCECIQVFVTNPPRQWPAFADEKSGSCSVDELPTIIKTRRDPSLPAWRAKVMPEKDITKWKNALNQSDLAHPIAHASYLINLASPKDELFRKSIDALMVELDRCNRLQIEGLVLHPGAYTTSNEEDGLRRIIDGLSEVLERTEHGTCKVLLENTAGQGTCLGHRFEQLGQLLQGVNNHSRIGICMDTCHAFAAGYELNTDHGFSEMSQLIEDVLPKNSIKALHLNDSKKPLGSRVDRHEHIGLGEIGLEGFRLLSQHPILGQLPGYLETEKGLNEKTGEDWDVINLRTLRNLA
ncbi:deoxyribonuclease IV [bacterium]|nr:deoxyribonuclease IV [Rubripirellula sp.]MDB4338628.1 deoxyribonuclease IV [Rubripirellula sp.]MDB4676895.1 deoxyribonuclease IV [bacterium]